MNRLLQSCAVLALAWLLGSCTIGNWWICGPQTPAAYCDSEAYEKLLYPKTIGKYWEKPGTIGGGSAWESDWVECGGKPNGDYFTGVPNGSSNEVIFAADEKKRKELAACMLARGYHFTGNWRPY